MSTENRTTYLDSNKPSACCGCGACVSVCPCNAISMVEGKDKALYPQIDNLKCINCGKCRNVCGFKKKIPKYSYENKKAYVAIINDKKERSKSASGGAFIGVVNALKKKHKNLYVAGATWQKSISVKHELLPVDEVDKFRKSKYVQSDTHEVFAITKEKLDNDEAVLFSGTPCQIAELKHYLEKEYEKLYTVDLVCHGVPGNSIFHKYINSIEKKHNKKVINVVFRHKKKDIYGETHSDLVKVTLEDGQVLLGNNKTNSYLRGFRTGLFYRESCYSCPYANPDRLSDITIGDYWNIQKKYTEYVDYTGVSCLLINSERGKEIFDNMEGLETKETTVEYLLNNNSQLVRSSEVHTNRNKFFEDYNSKEFEKLIVECIGKPEKMKNILSKLIPGKLKRKVKLLIKR